MISVTIIPASKPPPIARSLPLTVQLPAHATVYDIKSAICKQFPKVRFFSEASSHHSTDWKQFYASRQKLSLKNDKKPLSDEIRLVDIGIWEGGELVVKDLGPQIKWKTVFLVEYVSRHCVQSGCAVD